MSFMTVETTNLIGCVCFSLQCDDKDIQNGAIVGKGELVKGERSIYKAVEASEKNGYYLVANPAWSYDDSTVTAQNEENFTNVKGVPFRAYELKKDKKFKLGNMPADPALNKDDYIKYDFSTGKYAKGANNDGLKIVEVEDHGFPYCIGSYGVKLTSGDEKYGYALDTRNKKYTVEVVAMPTAGE